MERAQNGMVNLRLQNTSPEILRQMALAKYGSLTPEHEGQGVGPGPMMSEQPDAGGDDLQSQKGDPKELAEEKQGYPGAGVDHGVDHDQHDDPAFKYRKLKPELDEILRPQVGLAPRQPQKDGQEGNPGKPSPAELRLQARRESQERQQWERPRR